MSDTDALYEEAILALAREGRGNKRLEHADATARVDNPLCGDRVTIDLALDGETVTAVGHRVQGCALCEASAAIIARNLVGRPAATVGEARAGLLAYLDGADEAVLVWPQLSAFAPVRDFKSRRDCVRLPFDAALKALAEREKT